MADTVDSEIVADAKTAPLPYTPTLKKIPPYWHPYRTFAKQRWWNREILELVSTEFRDRSVEYYRFALQSGVTTINGKVAKPGTIVRNGDRIENIVHRHEPPVTSIPVKIMHRDDAQEIIVIDKPGSIPVHATGRYFKNSLIEILQNDFGFPKVYTVNRLDRLTSGCMIIALSSRRAKLLCEEFVNGTVQKEYIARCSGEFPEEEITVEEPLLTVDRQMGLNIVHPEGKYSKTTFKRLFYDAGTNTSVLHCRPWTGRSHQIRVHLQYIGYPIANDPVYGDSKVWGKNRGRGGVSLIPSDSRTHTPSIYYPDSSSPGSKIPESSAGLADPSVPRALLPREDGTDIGIASPVPLSDEAVQIIKHLRSMKDEDEDNARWRDVIFRAKAALDPRYKELPPRGPKKSRRPPKTEEEGNDQGVDGDDSSEVEPHSHETEAEPAEEAEPILVEDVSKLDADLPPGPALYCPECYLPLLPDPRPEKLFIFLHAWKYTTKEWSFSTDMPFWAAEGYTWEKEDTLNVDDVDSAGTGAVDEGVAPL